MEIVKVEESQEALLIFTSLPLILLRQVVFKAHKDAQDYVHELNRIDLHKEVVCF